MIRDSHRERVRSYVDLGEEEGAEVVLDGRQPPREEAYSYFGPSFRARTTEEEWVAEEETFGITGSTVNSVEVGEVSEDGTFTATVDVSFEDETGTPSFVIEWALVEEDGRWKLDEVLSSSEGDA